MTDVMRERAGVPVLVCDPDGPPIATMDDALDARLAVRAS
jgi:hypothetical protein